MSKLSSCLALATSAAALAFAAAPAAASVDSLVAARPDGGAHFAWTASGSAGLLEERVMAADGSLGETQFASAAHRQASSQAIGVDSAGNAVVAWLALEDGAWVVRARRRDADGALSAAQRLSPAGANAFWLRLAVEPDGDAMVVWSRVLGGRLVVQARRRAAGGELGPVATLSYAGADAAGPEVAIAPDGSATVVWLRSAPVQSGTIQRVQARAIAPDGSLDAIETLTPTTYSAGEARVVMSDAGTAVIAWTDGAAGPVRHRVRTAAGALGPTVTVAPAAASDSLALAGNGAGRVAFAWSAIDGADHRTHGRIRAAGGSLGPAFDLGGLSDDQAAATVAVDPQGSATFAWLEGASGDAVVHARRRTAAGAMGQLRLLSDSTGEAGAPHLAVDGAGKATVAWLWKPTGQHQTRTITAGGTVSPVRQISGG